jgi:enamine deaminase RidA (YjgF/YER057c/UK114 family)
MKAVLYGLFAALSLFAAAYGGARDEAKVVMPSEPGTLKLWEAWGFCDAIVIDNTIYLSGVVASTKDGDKGLEDAYARAFDRIGTILTKTGAGWDDVIDITSFHTNLKTQMPAMVAVKNRYVRAPFPAWTAIEVTRLIPDNGITEIKLVAKLPAQPRKL